MWTVDSSVVVCGKTLILIAKHMKIQTSGSSFMLSVSSC